MKSFLWQLREILPMILIFSSFGAVLGVLITVVFKKLLQGLLAFFIVATLIHWVVLTRSGQWNSATSGEFIMSFISILMSLPAFLLARHIFLRFLKK